MAAYYIIEWITITAPQDIHKPATEYGQAWLRLLGTLGARLATDGLDDTVWTRVIEEKEKLWILTCTFIPILSILHCTGTGTGTGM